MEEGRGSWRGQMCSHMRTTHTWELLTPGNHSHMGTAHIWESHIWELHTWSHSHLGTAHLGTAYLEPFTPGNRSHLGTFCGCGFRRSPSRLPSASPLGAFDTQPFLPPLAPFGQKLRLILRLTFLFHGPLPGTSCTARPWLCRIPCLVASARLLLAESRSQIMA